MGAILDNPSGIKPERVRCLEARMVSRPSVGRQVQGSCARGSIAAYGRPTPRALRQRLDRTVGWSGVVKARYQ